MHCSSNKKMVFEVICCFFCAGVDPDHPEEVPGLFEGDIDLQPGENPLVSYVST